ncbi:FDXHR family putative zinc-binding protein [Brachybacterium hainanense]|uniref:FDXHR family putative zinc-binding protein n=1 Tax=Brachybacterium hainanense TaxID=1541174 RepID=UPI00406BDA00
MSETYPQKLSRLRSTCSECAEGTERPEHVSVASWHEWGHCSEGAPDTRHPRCTCGVELKNGPRFWHCAGCHETFAGEGPFTRHRRGSGSDRFCLDLRDTVPIGYWSDENNVWHLGDRRGEFSAPGANGDIVLAMSAA